MTDNLWTHASHEFDVWEAAPLADLIIHIVEHYHLEARVLLARLENLMAEAVLLEGGEHPGLFAIRDQVDHFSRGFRAHMNMEEQSLFPHLLDPGSGSPLELMPQLVKLLEDEHRAETEVNLRLRALIESHWPIDGPRDLRARLGDALRALEESLEGHLYLESQVLFRRVF